MCLLLVPDTCSVHAEEILRPGEQFLCVTNAGEAHVASGTLAQRKCAVPWSIVLRWCVSAACAHVEGPALPTGSFKGLAYELFWDIWAASPFLAFALTFAFAFSWRRLWWILLPFFRMLPFCRRRFGLRSRLAGTGRRGGQWQEVESDCGLGQHQRQELFQGQLSSRISFQGGDLFSTVQEGCTVCS